LLTCKQGQVAQKQVAANPRLDMNRVINFSCKQMFFFSFLLYILRLFKLKKEGQTIYRNPHCKVTKLKSNINQALNNKAQEQTPKSEFKI